VPDAPSRSHVWCSWSREPQWIWRSGERGDCDSEPPDCTNRSPTLNSPLVGGAIFLAEGNCGKLRPGAPRALLDGTPKDSLSILPQFYRLSNSHPGHDILQKSVIWSILSIQDNQCPLWVCTILFQLPIGATLLYDHFGPREEGQVRLEQPCFSSLLFGCFRHPWHLLYFVVRYCTDSALIINQEDVWQLPQRVAP